MSISLTKNHTRGLPEGLDEVQICELVEINKGLKNFDVEIIPVDHKQIYYLYTLTKEKKKRF